jgi:YidC/Oxa1 family membrane protein insertase
MGFFEYFAGTLAALYGLVHNYGLAIILLTVLVRLILLPLSIKQVRSMREMQRIQPEMKRLQAKYKGDRQKLNEEMMKLYKEHGVNPFGGCLPLLSQLIVLIPLFQVLRRPLAFMGYHLQGTATYVLNSDVSGLLQKIQQSSLASGLKSAPQSLNNFLGIHLDCSAASTVSGKADVNIVSNCGQGIVAALPYLLLVLIMGLTTYVQQKQMQVSRTPGDPGSQQMQTIGKVMPIMLMVFSYAFPAGLVIYWLTTNLWMIGQQRLMFRAAPPLPAIGEGGSKGNGNVAKNASKAAKPATGKPQQKSPGKKTTAEAKSSTPTASKPHPSSKKKKKR